VTGEGKTSGLSIGVGNGETSATVPEGKLTFAIAPLTAKRGTEIILRNYATSETALIYTQHGNGPKDKMAYGISGIADQTMSGTIISGAGSNAVRPIAILGVTRRRTVYIAGDSIALGYGPSAGGNNPVVQDASGLLGCIAQAFGREYGYINGAIGGATIQADVAGGYTIRDVLASFCTDVIVETGLRDILDGISAADVMTARTAFAAKFSGKRVFGTTLTPSPGSSSDGYSTLGGQSFSNPATEAARVSFNEACRAGISGEADYIELADAFESDRNSGRFAVGLNSGATSGDAITDDGLHFNKFGLERARPKIHPRPVELISCGI
jgi:hypothetical protein